MKKLYGGLPKTKLPKTWEEAARSGSKYYYTGKPCVRGHKSPRYTRGAGCVECQRESTYKWREENREKWLEVNREAGRRMRERHPEKVRKYNRDYYHRVIKPKREAAKCK